MFLIHLRPIFLSHKNYSIDMQNKSVIWDSTDVILSCCDVIFNKGLQI